MARSQERIIIVGTNGTGKSTLSKKIIDTIASSDNKRALALLPDDSEPIFRSYNEISRSELKYINQVANRYNKIYFDNRKIFADIETHFKNGVLVLDDARYYTSSSDEELKKVFIRSRQNNLDVVFICHGLSEIPPSLITYSTKIILLNTVDSWERLKKKIPNPEYFESLVNKIRSEANDHKFSIKQIGNDVKKGNSFLDIFTNKITAGNSFIFKNRDGETVKGYGCNAFNREKCNCGKAYVKKIIDVKRDLIQGNFN